MSKTESFRFIYLVPVHNEEIILEETVAKLTARLANFPGSRILLLENGSQDRSWEIARRLQMDRNGVEVVGWHLDQAGLGLAYKLGVQEALRSTDCWVVFAAADLPFETTDLDTFLEAKDQGLKFSVATGSKLHEESLVPRKWYRRAMSRCFWSLRRMLLQMKTRDCQGSVIIHSQSLSRLAQHLKSDNYFFTTELIYFAERLGFEVQELPVLYAGDKRPSTVRPLYHGWKMLCQVLSLCWHERIRPKKRESYVHAEA